MAERFTTKSVGSNLAALQFYDEFLGCKNICALPKLTVNSIVKEMVNQFAVEYGRDDQIVLVVVIDADPILNSVVPRLTLCKPAITSQIV